VAACPFTLKSILRQKGRRIMETQNISSCKNILDLIFKKIPLKETKNPSRYHNSVLTNLKFQHKQAKKLSSFKNPHTKYSPLLCLGTGVPKA
jgi:hypothetical protein